MESDSVFKNLSWIDIKTHLMNILGGSESELVGRKKSSSTTSDHPFPFTDVQLETLELFKNYAAEQRASTGKCIAIPKIGTIDEAKKMHTLVKDLKRGLSANKDITKKKSKYMLNLIIALGYNIPSVDASLLDRRESHRQFEPGPNYFLFLQLNGAGVSPKAPGLFPSNSLKSMRYVEHKFKFQHLNRNSLVLCYSVSDFCAITCKASRCISFRS